MKNLIKNFANNLLSKEQMQSVKGGWNYGWSCVCNNGATSAFFTGSGNLAAFRGAAAANCNSGVPVWCAFR
jgi:hypothetical protein